MSCKQDACKLEAMKVLIVGKEDPFRANWHKQIDFLKGRQPAAGQRMQDGARVGPERQLGHQW
jgi:hypothetical protein